MGSAWGVARRATRVLKVFLVLAIAVAVLLSYTMYKAAGEYSAEVMMVRAGDDYTVERLIVRARPERLQGDYVVTLVFHVRITMETPSKVLSPIA